MISQQQNDIRVPEEETPPPHDQKQPSALTFSWRSWSLWLRILGVVLAFVGVYVGMLLWAFLTPMLGDWWIFGGFLFIVVGAVCAGLIRSWWSLLIVPVVFGVGNFLLPLIIHPFGVPEFSLVTLAIVEIGVAIGTAIDMLIEKPRRH
ncbi:MAG: hypothetical protein ACXVCM_07865 [Ktedonobacteraceae bacterium]